MQLLVAFLLLTLQDRAPLTSPQTVRTVHRLRGQSSFAL